MTLKTMTRGGAALALVGLVAVGTPALADKVARCVIKTSDPASYSGPCKFTLDRGGTFTVTPIGHRVFAPGVTALTVEIDGANADVRGLTTDGVNSMWGPVTRSAKDKACWIGEDFSVCVY